MKTVLVAMAILLLVAMGSAQTITLQKLEGSVKVRHGVMEEWTSVAAGDILRPDDTILIGDRASAIVVAPREGGAHRVILPSRVMVDMADLRDLTAEELMLKLTMERVRVSPYKSADDPRVPNAAVVHGSDMGAEQAASNDGASGQLQWNGVRVLFANGFYSTSALKGLELFRLYPATRSDYGRRILVAQSLEKASLKGEAANEYAAILAMDGLTREQQTTIRQRLDALGAR